MLLLCTNMPGANRSNKRDNARDFLLAEKMDRAPVTSGSVTHMSLYNWDFVGHSLVVFFWGICPKFEKWL